MSIRFPSRLCGVLKVGGMNSRAWCMVVHMPGGQESDMVCWSGGSVMLEETVTPLLQQAKSSSLLSEG